MKNKRRTQQGQILVEQKILTRPALLVLCSFTLKGRGMYFNCFFEKKMTMVVIVLSFLFRISDFQNGSVEDWQFPIHPHPTETPLLFLKKKTNWCVQLCEPAKKHEKKTTPDPKQCIRSKPRLPCKPKNKHKNPLYVWRFPKMMVPNNHGFSY